MIKLEYYIDDEQILIESEDEWELSAQFDVLKSEGICPITQYATNGSLIREWDGIRDSSEAFIESRTILLNGESVTCDRIVLTDGREVLVLPRKTHTT